MLLPALLHCQLPTCLRPLAAGFRAARLRSRDPFAGLKHRGSEERIEPMAGSPNCQTLLSEPPRNYFKPCLYLPSCTANCQLACVLLQLAFVLHGSGQGTPSQGSTTMAMKHGSGPWPAAQTAKRWPSCTANCQLACVLLQPLAAGFRLPSCTANCQQLPTCLRPLAAGFRAARLQSRDPFTGRKHHGSEGRPVAGTPNCQTLLSELPRN